MMEGECLVQFTYAKEYTLCAIQWILSVDLCGLPVIPWVLLGIATVIIARFLLRKYPAWDSKKKDSKGHPNKPRHEKWFYAWIIGVAVLGGTWAFFLPIAINSGFGKDDDGAALRQALIYTTGGILGVITLGETHRKNTLEKDKNDQDHTRQVHAERRSRYTKAVEHLFNENISVRLGGVYALAGLADEWLTDEKTLRTDKERRKEGQVIINTLCSYIRSSFNLASKIEDLSQDQTPEDYEGGDQQFVKDRAKLREEQELRLAILEAIKTRLNGGARIHKDGTREILKGLWSDFNYDFSNTVFFYPTDFSSSLFGASSNFFKTTFTQGVTFYTVKFTRDTNFFEAKFTGSISFSGAKFTKDAEFSKAEFTGVADFSKTEFTRFANFSRTEFTGFANFSEAEFTGFTDFSEAEFTAGGNFFWSVDFSAAKFTKSVNFSETTFEDKPRFEYTLDNKTCKARFSCKADPEDYNFKVSHNSPYKIETKEQEHKGIKFIIPKDAELFDPDEPSEQGNNDGS